MQGNTRKKTTTPAKNSSAKTARSPRNEAKTPHRREIMAGFCFVLSIFSLIGFWSDEGAFIGLFCKLIKGLVGAGFFALPPVLLLCAIILCFHRGRPVRFRTISALLITVATGALVHLFSADTAISSIVYEISFKMFPELWRDGISLKAGGAVSGSIIVVFKWLFGKTGAAIVVICVSLFLLLSAFNRTIAGIVDAYKRRERRAYIPEPEVVREPAEPAARPHRFASSASRRKRAIDIPLDDDTVRKDNEDTTQPEDINQSEDVPKTLKDNFFKPTPRVKTPDQLISEYTSEPPAGNASDGDISDDTDTDTAEKGVNDGAEDKEPIDLPLDIPFMEKKRTPAQTASNSAIPTAEKPVQSASAMLKEADMPTDALFNDMPIVVTDTEYSFPPLDLLTAGTPVSRDEGFDEIRMNSERLEASFKSFGVNVVISNTTRGPSVTRYEAELEAGVKLSKLTGLADDIALSLGTSGVRIAAMPNKISTVGIEVPNKKISTVYLRDILESKNFTANPSKSSFAIGMDISGETIVGTISKLPHLLVAGTTGSGKSVCLNSIILSILYKATPDDVRFIMIDPKMVEFKVYNDIPHLLVPVVTDVKKAAGALQWAVVAMMKRYAMFSEVNARDIDGYNAISRASDEPDPLPQIIVVIDELADLMMTAAKEVEESVCRVAQMGRAAGVHLVIATQSPRADVITGLMKANIPSRIALKVSSALESRIILDAGGNADKLVGNGDMLYAPIGASKPMRIQGT